PPDTTAPPSESGSRPAGQLDAGLAGSGEPLDQVIDHLRERQMLFVLDNFEQLSADASVLERLLQACPGLRFIVTSRLRLNLSMEWLFPLEGLPCPEVDDEDRIEALDAARRVAHGAPR